MLKMSLLRTAINGNRLIRVDNPKQGLASLLRDSLKNFSNEAEQPNPDSPAESDSFLQTPKTGMAYGRIYGISRNTTRSDILHMLEGSNLSLDDLKIDYNRSYSPLAMMVQFPSRAAYDAGFRTLSRKGRLFRMEKADCTQWDTITTYSGKSVLLQGIPRNAVPDDVERFLSGCQYDSTSLQIFVRQGFPDPIRMALVRFPSQTRAMHAFITKNRGFCLNNQVSVRVLE